MNGVKFVDSFITQAGNTVRKYSSPNGSCRVMEFHDNHPLRKYNINAIAVEKFSKKDKPGEVETVYTFFGNMIEANMYSLKDLMNTIRQFKFVANGSWQNHKYVSYPDASLCKSGDYYLHSQSHDYTPAYVMNNLEPARLREFGIDPEKYFRRDYLG